jgi:hypothetical protein
VFLKQPSFPSDHHRASTLPDGSESRIELDGVSHTHPSELIAQCHSYHRAAIISQVVLTIFGSSSLKSLPLEKLLGFVIDTFSAAAYILSP